MLLRPRLRRFPALFVGCALWSVGCAVSPPAEGPAAEKPQTPLERAEAALRAEDLARARDALREHLDGSPDDAKSRYLLAKTLAGLGELRAARREVRRSLADDPESPLAWDLLGSLEERLGEHHAAIEAYREVQQRSTSLSPTLAIARCQLYLGRPEAALVTLRALRGGKVESPWTEYFTYEALRRLDRADDAEIAARAYLERAAGRPEHAATVGPVRRWLESHRASLPAPARQAMVDAVRAACRLRLPGSESPEDTVLVRAPERLYAFDDRPVFLTLYARGRRFFGRGRGKSLAAALKGALEDLRTQEGFTPLAVRGAALRIDVGGVLEPVELRLGPDGLECDPAWEPGRHGLALRVDGSEVIALPGDPLDEDLEALEDVLARACLRAGLGAQAWRSALGLAYRFEAESFLSPAPGASPLPLQHSEPTPFPEPSARAVGEALEAGATWLGAQILPSGGLAAGYSPARDAFDPGGEGPVAEADADAVSTAVRAFEALAGRLGRAAFAAARDHLTAWLRKRGGASGEGSRPRTGRADGSAGPAGRTGPSGDLSRRGASLGPDELRRLLGSAPPSSFRARVRRLTDLARGASWARERGDALAQPLREAVLSELRWLLPLQLAARHRHLCRHPERALGGFRRERARPHLRAADTAEALLALLACADLLER